MKRGILIVGPPRSGMSPMAGVLRILGVDLGRHIDTSTVPSLCTFEHRDLREIHRKLLATWHSSWSHFDFPQNWHRHSQTQPYKDALVKILLLDFEKSPLFAFKDQALTLLLPLYLDIFHELKIEPMFIVMQRCEEEVVRSLGAKYQMPADQAAPLYHRYVEMAEKGAGGKRKVNISFDALVTDTVATIDKIRMALDAGLKGWYGPLQEALDFIHPGLKHDTVDPLALSRQFELLKVKQRKTEEELARVREKWEKTFEFHVLRAPSVARHKASRELNQLLRTKVKICEALFRIRKLFSKHSQKYSDSVGILGRGVSLSRASCLRFLDDFIIVNQFDKEINQQPVKSLLKNKRIIHIVNYAERVLPRRFLFQFHIAQYQLTLRENDGTNNRLRRHREHRFPESVGYRPEYLPESLDAYLNPHGGYNAGTLSLIYAAMVLKKRHVYVAGMDFYDCNYWTDPEKVERDILRRPKLATRSASLKSSVTKIAKDFPHVNFYYVTGSTFDPQLPNVKMFGPGSVFVRHWESDSKNPMEPAGEPLEEVRVS